MISKLIGIMSTVMIASLAMASNVAVASISAQNGLVTEVKAAESSGSLGGVQLWEGGPYWAECNVGASNPEGYGTCFKWDDAEDAVSTHFGSSWRMPTEKEFDALVNKCDMAWTTRKGVYGIIITGKGAYASKSIFFPAVSNDSGITVYNFYWSSTLSSDSSSRAASCLYFFHCDYTGYSDYVGCIYYDCSYGQSVRPVRSAGQYTVKFDVNDEWFHNGSTTSILNEDVYPATGTMSERSYIEGQDVVLTESLYAREGFEFGGWATAPNFDAVYQDGDTINAADLPTSADGLTLYAVWNAKKVTVTFNYQNWPGASENIKTKSYTVGYAPDWPYGQTSDADVIEGWYTAPTGGTRVDNVTWWIPTKNTTYYLHWRHKTCTIKYKANGGTGSMPDQAFTMGINQKLSVNQFARTGYVFSGWAKSSDGEAVYKDGEGVLLPTVNDGETVTLYAVWTASVDTLYKYTISDGCATITKYLGTGVAISIPSTLGGCPVTAIDGSAFYNLETITSVAIPASVISIGEDAFSYCSSLTSVTIPNSVARICSGAFDGCSALTSISIPNGVKAIEDFAFADCSSLTSVMIPNGVTNIGMGAFCWCSSITSITIPNGVMTIGDSAFRGCSELASVSIPGSVNSIGSEAFGYCIGLTSIEVDTDNLSYKSSNGLLLTKDGCKLISGVNGDVIIPNSVTTIEDSAFCGCSCLTSVTIPNGITKIGDYAFYDCNELTSMTIPNSVTNIGMQTFFQCCGLTSITIPNSVISIGSEAFSTCLGLTSITIPNSVVHIGKYAFSDCSNLNTVYVYDGDTERIKSMLSTIGDFPIDDVIFIELKLPDLQNNATAQDIADALSGSTDVRLSSHIYTVSSYNAFKNWANLAKTSDGISSAGVSAVISSPNAWLSFALGSKTLIETAPSDGDLKVDNFEPATESGKFDFTVSVKDVEVGSDAAAENLKKVFGLEGGTTLEPGGLSSDNVNISFGTPENGKVKFTAGPKNSSEGTFFMKVKMTP